MTEKAKNDLRHYSGAAGIFILIIFLLLFLSFNEIPPVNKDIFVTVTGMVVGSLSVVIYTIIGRNPDEVAQLTKKVESLETANDHLIKQKDELEGMVITLQENMIDKISILGASFIDNLIEKKEMKLKYFNDKDDFKGNIDKMDSKLLGMLDALRAEYGFPIVLTSSYRSPEHPIEAAKDKPGEHSHGAAVDIKCVGGEATLRLVKAALKVGFLRIGVSRKKNFVHVGIGYPGAPKMTMWTY